MENKIHFDRSRQPETVIPERLEVPEACEYRTASGVRIYVLPAPEYGVVRLSFVFRAGSSWQKVPFCASATVNNLAEGSRDMTARQIAERLDYYGSWFDVSMDRDWSVVTFVCLSKFFDKTLEVARRIMLEPEFPQEELRVYCDKSRQTLAINRTKVDFNARELFAKSLYGASHPYGISSPAERYDDLRREDVRAFYEERYTAAGCFAVMSGDVDDIRLRAVEEFLVGLRPGEAGERADFPAPRSISRAEMPFPGAVQSAVRVGRVLFPRSHPDFIGMQVVAAVLGWLFRFPARAQPARRARIYLRSLCGDGQFRPQRLFRSGHGGGGAVHRRCARTDIRRDRAAPVRTRPCGGARAGEKYHGRRGNAYS